jgi:Carboxypeptidase regulatory-like domain
MKLYFLLIAAVLGTAGQTAQIGTANSNPSLAGGSAGFLGTVVDAAGKPLENVHVTLTVFGEKRLLFGREPVAIYGSMTNEKGRFSIPEVPPGSYEVALEKRGYLMVPSETSTRGPVSGDHVQLKAGEHFTDVVLHMARRAIITGRLLGEYGEPLANARVSAKAAGSIEGRWKYAMTDDRGEFRLGLLPGKYLVAADASSHMPADAHLSGNRGNYQFTYFPGVATDKEASLVEALPGGVTGDIDFKAIRVATYTVKVEVTGIPESSGNLFIRYTGKEGSGSQSQTVDAKGGTASMLLGPWPAGAYRLTASYSFGGTELQSRPTDVTVATSDVQGILLPLAPVLELDGTIEIKGGQAPLEPVKRTVRLLPTDQPFSVAGTAESGADGVFKIASIPPGSYIVMVEPLPKNGFIQRIELNEKPVKDLKPDLSGVSYVGRLKIGISLNGAHITGTLDQRGQIGQTKIVLLPRNEEPAPANFHMTAPEEDGSYSFEGIAPGDYILVAFRLSSDLRKMPELIQRNRESAVKLEVKEGDKIVKDLKVISEENNASQK